MARSEPEQPAPSPGNPTIAKGSEPPVRVGRPGALGFRSGIFLGLREQAPRWQVVVIGLVGVGGCLALWWFVTRGEPEERIISPSKGLSSPWETFASFHSLWFDRGLTRNLLTTLRRVCSGFGLATLVGVPLGVLCGCFSRVNALFLPMTLFGRNIPVAALIPLTFSLFGIGELQKVMFIFIACVAFIISDTARAIGEVRESVHRLRLYPGGRPLADDLQGACPAGPAQRLQLLAAAVFAGLRLHHAGRGHQVRRRIGRAG